MCRAVHAGRENDVEVEHTRHNAEGGGNEVKGLEELVEGGKGSWRVMLA